MNKLSKSPFFYKRIFPFMFAVPLLVLAALPYSAGQHPPPPPFFLILGVAWLIMIVVWRQLFRNLADEVMDAGDHLLITQKGHQFEVPLSNIINISATMMMNPPMATLRLRTAGPYGRDISFLPLQRRQLRFWASNEFINDLVDRIDAQRQKESRKKF